MQRERVELSRYRLARAEEDLATAELDHKNGMYRAAVIFYLPCHPCSERAGWVRCLQAFLGDRTF